MPLIIEVHEHEPLDDTVTAHPTGGRYGVCRICFDDVIAADGRWLTRAQLRSLGIVR